MQYVATAVEIGYVKARPMKSKAADKCALCGNGLIRPKECVRCRQAVYCSKAHQKEHWKIHKKTCKKNKKKD